MANDPFIEVKIRMQQSIYDGMVECARKATEGRGGMTIGVDAVISTACKARLEEESATGRQVTIKGQ